MNNKTIIKWLVLPMAFALTACNDYQSSIDDLTLAVNGVESRLTVMENKASAANSDIAAIEQIVNAQLQAGYITGVSESDGTYTLSMSNGTQIVVRDGTDGQNGTDGTDGHTPVIGVKQDTDGNWYWTVDGAFLLDEAGSKVRANGLDGAKGDKGDQGDQGVQGEQGEQGAQGEQGVQGEQGEKGDKGDKGDQGEKGDKGDQGEKGDKGADGQDGTNGTNGTDGITPQLRINTTTLMWEVSLDNGATWTSLGVKAQGDKGEKGDKGDKGDKGKDGDAFFKSVSVGDTEVTFTLADGVTTFTLPLMDTFKKVRDRVQSIVFIPENIDGMMTLQNGVATTVRYRVMPVEVATALATSYASTLSFIGEEVAVTRAATSAALAISGVADEGSGRLAVTVTASGMDADKGYAFALLMNDGTSMYSTAYTSVFFAIPPTKIGIAANGVTAGSGQVEVGTSIQLFALMVPTTTNMKQVTWSSSDAAVAKVDADGMLTAISDGTAVITVRSNADTSVAKSITVTVKEGALSLNTEELVSQSEAE